MTTHTVTADRPTTAPGRPRWHGTAALAALVVADLLAFQWWLMHRVDVYQHQHNEVGRNPNFLLESDLAQPVTYGLWLLVLGNGLLLCVPRQTRRAGVAMLTAVGLLVAALLAWWTGAIIMFASGA